MKYSYNQLSKKFCASHLIFFFIGFFIMDDLLAQPVISSFSPKSGAVGTSVTISGANFGAKPADNVVYFGAVRAKVLTASSNTLTVTVPRGATYQPIAVTAYYLTAYSNLPFTVTFAGGDVLDKSSFAPKTEFTGSINRVAVIDINNDGKPDVADAGTGYPSATVLKNTSHPGTLSFKTKTNLPRDGFKADFNGDGKFDLAEAEWPGLTVLLNTSTDTNMSFEKIKNYRLGNEYAGEYVDLIACSDLNSDGKPDLIVRSTGDIDGLGSYTISILKNISTPESIAFQIWYEEGGLDDGTPSSLAIGDFDGDRKPDLVFTYRHDYDDNIEVWRNTTSGTYFSVDKETHYLYEADDCYFTATGDFDNDGKLDIVGTVSNFFGDDPDKVVIFRNTSVPGNISFGPKISISPGVGLSGAAIGDLNGDGKPDIAVSDYGSNDRPEGSVSVFKNTSTPGSVSFDPGVKYLTQLNPGSVALGDMDGDGRTDIITGSYTTVSVLRNLMDTGVLAGEPRETNLISSDINAPAPYAIKLFPNPATSCIQIHGLPFA